MTGIRHVGQLLPAMELEVALEKGQEEGFHSGDEKTANPARKTGESRGMEAGKQEQVAKNEVQSNLPEEQETTGKYGKIKPHLLKVKSENLELRGALH